jgi:dTDP-4-amino-4,6-dideoxygalactose transaminase
MSNNVPFLDLITPHKELEPELTAVFHSALRTAGFIGGAMVENFESAFAKFCEVSHCVGVNSGTDALRFALTAAGVSQGDIVVTVPNTFIATTEAISQAGAEPAFVDIDENTYNMDAEKLREYLQLQCSRDPKSGFLVHARSQKRVRAVVPVHLYGQMADMDAILELAEQYNLLVIEDACQAHGAEYFSAKHNCWKRAGSLGHAAAFSFYPGKNLGACGEAGAVTTNDQELAKKVSMLRDHGQAKKYYHDCEGYNGRLDAIQAGFLHVKLGRLEQWNSQRRQHAQQYSELFATESSNVILPSQPRWSKPVHHLYVVRVQQREELQRFLSAAGIGTGIHYPIPLHLQKAYASLPYRQGDLPISERVAPEILSLPMFPNLTMAEQRRVVSAIREFMTLDSQEKEPAALGASR